VGLKGFVSKLFGKPSAVQVIVTVKTPTPARKVFLGETELVFDTNGVSRTMMPPDTYSLFWRVFGGDGQMYSLEITAPPSAAWKSGDLDIVAPDDIGAHHPVVVK